MLGAAAAGAGITVGLVAGIKPAEAANNQGEAVLLGQSGSNANTATSTTQINTTGGDGLQANTTGDSSSHGIFGSSAHGIGVCGKALGNGGYGVCGIDASRFGGSGVVGSSTVGDGIFGSSTYGIGVTAIGATGLWAVGLGAGYGVQATDTTEQFSTPVFAEVVNIKNGSPALNARTGGMGSAVEAKIDNTRNTSPAVVATTNGTGPAVLASHPDGTALQVEGVASFSRSGSATVTGTASAPRRSVLVTGVALNGSSMILATPQGRVAGVSVEGVVTDATANTFTIYLTNPVTESLAIAWLVLG
jgi:hypothetical protein